MNDGPWAVTGWIFAGLAFLGVVVRQIGPWRKQISDIEERLRAELHSEITILKEQLVTERLEHSTEMRAFNLERDEMGDRLARMEKLMVRQQLRHNAERALDRHRINNLTQCFDAVVLLIETNPEKSPEIIARVKEMRATMLLAEAEEKAAIQAAEIAAAEDANFEGN